MKKALLSTLVVCFSSIILAQTDSAKWQDPTEPKGINIGNIVEMSGNWFIAFREKHEEPRGNSDMDKINTSAIYLKRSYFTLKKDLNKTFSVRYTQDLTVDKEGSDAGNVETRLKYLYLKAKPKINSDFFTGTFVEIGMVHTPWLDYEQKINTYRVQDNMAIERNKIFNSADFGITVAGNFGPKMDKEFLKNVNGAMKGKYVSYMLGVYNGGGYAGLEKNKNKVVAGRLSYRPFPEVAPEFHVSGNVYYGKGNTEHSPDYSQLLGFLAYTGKNLTLTGQYHMGTGDFRGNYVEKDNPEKALKNNGYSFFGEYRFGKTPWALWGRLDKFTLEKETKNVNTSRYIGGISYRLSKNIRFILDTEYSEYEKKIDSIYELNLEISF